MNPLQTDYRGADRIRTGELNRTVRTSQIHRTWASRRTAYLENVGHKCERCGSTSDLEVHHKNYERLGAEHDEDLEALCRPCHIKEHSGSHNGVLADGTDLRPKIRELRAKSYSLREIQEAVGINFVTVRQILIDTGGDPIPKRPYVDPEWFDNPTPLEGLPWP